MQARTQLWNECFEELWRKHRLLIILLIGALLFDTFSTIHFMTVDGIHLEIHPLIKYSALFLGPIVGTILSAFIYKTVTSIFLAMYLRRFRLWILVLTTVFSTFAGFFNLLAK